MYTKSSSHEQKIKKMLFEESLKKATTKDFLADFPEEEEEEEFMKVSLTPPKDFLADFPEEEEFTEVSMEFNEEEETEYPYVKEVALKKYCYYAQIEEAYDYNNPESLDVLLQSLKCILYDDEVINLFKWCNNNAIWDFWETFYEKVNNLRMTWEKNTQNEEIDTRFRKYLMKFSCWIDTFYYKIC